MSDSLLQRSIKVVQRSQRIKKKKQAVIQKLKRKRELLNSKILEEEEIEKNLKNLQQLNKESAVNISEEVFYGCQQNIEKDKTCEETEESTVFTDKDFEDFEKYYLGS